MARLGGSRRKKVGVFTKDARQQGKVSQRSYLQSFHPGDRVVLKLEPGVQRAAYLPRFHGKTGVVKRKQGGCYAVTITDGGKHKEVVAHPIHLKKA
ncbi:50S ribosomal protein L21e [Candidatus Woesearchaeota archaeon]|nr:50S ribosomal protein L21e [Candidatus Woesearchaeota archaeon]